MGRYQIVIIFILAFVMQASHSQIYMWKDGDGKVHFGDKKPTNNKSEKIQLKINTYKSVTIDPSILKSTKKTNTNKSVTIYSTTWCSICKKAKRYFNKNNISYIEYDIDKDKAAKKRHKAMGATGVPVIFIGNRRMNGFSAASFERIYKN
jgi:glutaredoxin